MEVKMAFIQGTPFDDGAEGSLFIAVIGTGEDDLILGYGGNDVLNGFGGNDTVMGGTGADTMRGGPGNDIYFVDSAGDVVQEGTEFGVSFAGDNGLDHVISTVSFTLPANIEDLTLQEAATEGRNGTGNELNNVITGNRLGDVLNGLGGQDTLRGGAGDDTLYGGSLNDELIGGDHADKLYGESGYDHLVGDAGAFNDPGNDTLDGGQGGDTMEGGGGDDVYFVGDPLDRVIEADGAGHDTVKSTLPSYTLGDFVEDLVLQDGAGLISGTGNGLDNTITGNNRANTLRGLLGADTLNGGDGDDTLEGGRGADDYHGGVGKDTFKFSSIQDSNAGNGFDLIWDFQRGITTTWMGGRYIPGDKIDLSGIDAEQSSIDNDTFAFIGEQSFTGPGQVRVDPAGSFSVVQAEVNGDGVADFQLTVITTTDALLSAPDFIL
jgi:Ca2+-binding RTX toxin-like protein